MSRQHPRRLKINFGATQGRRQFPSPRMLPGFVGDDVVSDLDQDSGQFVRRRMALDRRVGLIDTDRRLWVLAKTPNHSIGQTAILIEDDADTPRS